MREKRNQIYYFMFIQFVILILFFLCLIGCTRRDFCRELNNEEIRPLLKRLIEKKLPEKVDDLRAIIYGNNEVKDVFIAFKTNQKGCEFILEEFGGQYVQKRELPAVRKNQKDLDIVGFYHGYRQQEKMKIDLFNKDLLDNVVIDPLRHNNENSANNSITGYFLSFDDESNKSTYYRILIFSELGTVYFSISAQDK